MTHRSRARDCGLIFGDLQPGPSNAITDVRDVRVGHATVQDDEWGIYTGVTAVTHPRLIAAEALAAGFYAGNGFGKITGTTQVAELGQIETPILLTSTLATFRVADALLAWLRRHADRPLRSVNPVVGEINDGWLSDVDVHSLGECEVFTALDTAAASAAQMGNVGGGTGACALGFKGGIGTSSRSLTINGREHHLGVLVQTNMAGVLRTERGLIRPRDLGLRPCGPDAADGSCVVVVAVDFPCPVDQLNRIARRGVYALARVGAAFSHGSGDYCLSFSTSTDRGRPLSPGDLDTLFLATLDCVEESCVDSLLAAHDIRTVRGRAAFALPQYALTRT